MWKYLFVLSLVAAFSVRAELPLTAHWDFNKKSINSVDGKRKMKFRGNSELVTENGVTFLKPGMTSGPTPSGIECIDGRQGLSPVGAFRIETEIAFTEQTSSRNQMYIFDTKNVPYVSKAPTDNVGIIFYIFRNVKNQTFALYLCCGNGAKSFHVAGKWIPCKLDKKYLLSVEYDPAGTVTFSVDGQKTVVKTPFGGALAPGFRAPVIGDRCGSNYNPVEGNIYWLKLYSAPANAKK